MWMRRCLRRVDGLAYVPSKRDGGNETQEWGGDSNSLNGEWGHEATTDWG